MLQMFVIAKVTVSALLASTSKFHTFAFQCRKLSIRQCRKMLLFNINYGFITALIESVFRVPPELTKRYTYVLAYCYVT